MLVPLIACEPAVFLFSPDGDIKQMGCDDVEHKPDEPRGSIRHLFLLRFAPRYRGQPEDAMNRNSMAAGMERMARCREREPGLEAGL